MEVREGEIRFTAASNPCPGPFIFSGNSAKAPPSSASSGVSLSPNVSPGAVFPGKREIFDHPIVQAAGVKGPTSLGHDLPTMSLPARSGAFDSASFHTNGNPRGEASLKMSTGSDFNPFPDLHVAAPPRDSHSPAAVAAPAEQKVPPPVLDQRTPESGTSGISSLERD